MEKWIDLTVLIDEDYLPYPGDEKWSYEQLKQRDINGYDLKRITMNMHVGTHLDAKKHVMDSNEDITSIDVNRLIGVAQILRPRISDNLISTQDIIDQYDGTSKIVLIETDHSRTIHTEEYYNQPKFSPDIVRFLDEYPIDVFGIDMPSPEYPIGDFLHMHRDLLSRNIIIVENLTNLDLLKSHVNFIALPLKIKGLDGSMVRCVAKNIDI